VLTKPEPTFLTWLTDGALAVVPSDVPPHTYHGLDGFTHDHSPVPGTGPYMVSPLTNWPHDIVLVRNPHFRLWSRAAQPPGFLDSIEIQAVPPSAHDLPDLAAGKIQVLDTTSLTAKQVSQAVSSSPVLLRPEGGSSFLRFAVLNTKLPPFNNRLARQALNYAVDRRRAMLMQQPGQVTGTPTCQLVRPGSAGYRPYCPYTLHPGSGRWSAPNVAKAKRLVWKSGTHGDPVVVWPTTNPDADPSSSYLASVLNQIGYHATLAPPNADTGNAFFGTGPHTAQVAGTGEGFFDTDGGGDIGSWACSVYNPARWLCDHWLDRPFRRGLQLEHTNPQAADELWAELDQQLTKAAPVVPLWTDSYYALVNNRVGNWSTPPSSGGIYASQLWVNG
jgi:peptide/nickel transport system substrate-binding protein